MGARVMKVRLKSDVVAAEIARLREERAEMLAELKTALCPGGGWNGMPEGTDPIVESCIAAGVCGCSTGALVKRAEGRQS